MRIATWNVNSIRTRAERVVDWLQRANIDVLAMQEIKCKPEQFPTELFERAGYSVTAFGLNQWNGVAFASRHEITDVATSFAEMPGFGNPVKGQEAVQLTGVNGLPQEARALGVTVNGVRLWSLYVPNGRGLDNPHFDYKLDWLRALQRNVTGWLAENPEQPLALMGDFNIAPLPEDMGDPSFTVGESTHVSPAERELFAGFAPQLVDVVRPYQPEGYTFWDYTKLRFPRNEGMRIDFILGSEAFNDMVVAGEIHRDERKQDNPSGIDIKPSDHVPVVCEIDQTLSDDEFADDFDAPMIFG